MDKELHILILEDVPDDAELMERELSKGGIVFISRRVETKEAFLKELKDFTPDLILADYSLPIFDGLSALTIAKEKCPDVPFIFVSGVIDEELAIEIIKRGATDYVFKHRLSRLVPAVNRAVREAWEKAESKRTEGALSESEHSYRTLAENLPGIVYRVFIRENNRIKFFNKISQTMTGYRDEELEADEVCPIESKIHQEDRPKVATEVKSAILDNRPFSIEYRFRHKDGNIRYFLEKGIPIFGKDGNPLYIDGVIFDITESKKSEKEVKKKVKELEEFYDMAVGRELRMVELKEEIEGLKAELSKYKKI